MLFCPLHGSLPTRYVTHPKFTHQKTQIILSTLTHTFEGGCILRAEVAVTLDTIPSENPGLVGMTYGSLGLKGVTGDGI
jgi:hypothetical protein